MIEQKTKSYFSNYGTLEALNYSKLSDAYNNDCDGFMKYDQLNFRAQTGCLYLTGNEVLHYPALAKELLCVWEYPFFKKSYQVSQEVRSLKGLDFLMALVEFVKTCEADFQNEVGVINARINNLIHLHGVNKTKPLITGAITNDNNFVRGLVVNGVPFPFADTYRREKENPLGMLNLRRLVNEKIFDEEYVRFEEAILNTSFFAVRVTKSYKHKGHVIWYNLDKMEIVAQKEISAFKKAKTCVIIRQKD